MTLIPILIGILIDRFAGGLPELRQYRHFADYVDWCRERLSPLGADGWVALVIILVPLLLVTGLLASWLEEWFWGLAGLLFSIAVLVYCLGPRDLPVDVEQYCEVCEGEDDAARWHAAQHFSDRGEVPDDPLACHEAVVKGVLVGALDRWFGVLFWFVVLGPVGAVLYRAAVELYRHAEENDFGGAVQQFYGLLGWIPARLMVAGYGLSGHFDSALKAWRNAPQQDEALAEHTARLLFVAGEGALSSEILQELEQSPHDMIEASMGLVWRTFSMWLVVIALLTLAGWAS